MATEAELLKRLEDAIASGVQSISYDGRQITYRSLEEMQEIAGQVKASVAAAADTDKRRHKAIFSRGY